MGGWREARGERGRDTRRAYSARCKPCRRYASRATRQDKRFYYEKSGGETKSRTARVRPAAFSPRGCRGKYPSLRGRRDATGKGASRSGWTRGEGEGGGEGGTTLRPPREVLEPYDPPYDPASQSLLSLPYTPPLAPLVARILSLGPLRHSSCFPDPFPSGPREGVVGVLSEGWRCQAPVAARTLSLGFLSFSRFVFSVPPPLRYRSRHSHSLARVPSIGIERSSRSARDLVPVFPVTSKEVHLRAYKGVFVLACAPQETLE